MSKQPKQTIRTNLRNLVLDDRPHEQFQILERLGKGSFGAVYKALHWSTGTVVAIKKCMTDDMDESEQEIDMMKGLDCNDIIRFYGCYIHDQMFWIVMEYCSLGALTDVMTLSNKLILSESQNAAVCKSVVRGLAYLHNSGKMHRDIKPENILLTENGVAKLADFGVAGTFGANDKRTTLTGTPYYIAPEILQEDCTGYDETADIWSMGICCIEFAQGEPPHYDIPPMRVMLHIANSPPPNVKNPSACSGKLLDFIKTCLVKDPRKRASAKKLLNHPFLKHAPECKDALKDIVDEANAAIEKSGGLEAALDKFKPPKKKKTDGGTLDSDSDEYVSEDDEIEEQTDINAALFSNTIRQEEAEEKRKEKERIVKEKEEQLKRRVLEENGARDRASTESPAELSPSTDKSRTSTEDYTPGSSFFKKKKSKSTNVEIQGGKTSPGTKKKEKEVKNPTAKGMFKKLFSKGGSTKEKDVNAKIMSTLYENDF